MRPQGQGPLSEFRRLSNSLALSGLNPHKKESRIVRIVPKNSMGACTDSEGKAGNFGGDYPIRARPHRSS